MKVNEARICLDCDEIYSGPGLCPGCGHMYSYYLVKWIKPLHPPTGPPRVIPNMAIEKPPELEG